jgi:hypothetical protein
MSVAKTYANGYRCKPKPGTQRATESLWYQRCGDGWKSGLGTALSVAAAAAAAAAQSKCHGRCAVPPDYIGAHERARYTMGSLGSGATQTAGTGATQAAEVSIVEIADWTTGEQGKKCTRGKNMTKSDCTEYHNSLASSSSRRSQVLR